MDSANVKHKVEAIIKEELRPIANKDRRECRSRDLPSHRQRQGPRARQIRARRARLSCLPPSLRRGQAGRSPRPGSQGGRRGAREARSLAGPPGCLDFSDSLQEGIFGATGTASARRGRRRTVQPRAKKVTVPSSVAGPIGVSFGYSLAKAQEEDELLPFAVKHLGDSKL